MLDINTNATAVQPNTADTTTKLETSSFGTAGAKVGILHYDAFAPNQVSAAHALADIETIKPRSRDQYVVLFKRTEQRTAIATLQMCRVVYEAKQTLAEHDFTDFCTAVGYKDDSSVIRKFCAIGKLQPRLVKHAAFMPHEWSKIYTLTQIPARLFEEFVEQQRDFRCLSGKELKELVAATQPERKSLEKLLPKDQDSANFVFARLQFTKHFVDAYDWRAVKKALAEVESRLPIKVQFVAAAEAAYDRTITYRYNQAKQNAKDVEFKPALWDYGTEAAQDNLKNNPAEPHTVEGTATQTVAITG
jgi:hypothetical protein